MELSKFRLSSMVVVTSGAGFAAAGLPLDYGTMAAVCTGTFLCAAAAGTFNQVKRWLHR
jgi:heme o synthase